ncbi:hypothetical protein G3I40_30240 [Streptomyces sp. SID14478]|uniref:hypothetical protein n=1 Tax=Streptomyces sp. SID14478 TaxID=2706073 RepID=UPI0013DA7F4A|nr:hypothetical protein [Streptomyces sp. SID14478]NEB79467.1 hypothetical protein [Streptomyces sp. SID14478]
MTTADEAAQVITNYYFAPVEGEVWPVDLEVFDTQAAARWPDYESSDERDPDLEFTYTRSADGAQRSAWYHPQRGIGLPGYGAVEAAEFVSWFLDLLPAETKVLFNNDVAIEDGDYDDHVVPGSMGLRPIAEAFASHLAEHLA